MEFTTRFELQSQATRLLENGPYAHSLGARTGLSPSLMLFSKRLRPRPQLVTPLQTTIRTRKSDLQRELFPLHSPLLGESWLVSFPPLSYMLKFSGSSCLIGGPNESWKRPRTANRNYVSHIHIGQEQERVGLWKSWHDVACRRPPKRPRPRRRRAMPSTILLVVLVYDGTMDLSFTRFGALGARAPEHAESAASQQQQQQSWRSSSVGRVVSTDTPTSMLPGNSRKRKMRSKFWWFTGFCKSQDVSHFAAFFIVVGAKTSVAESFTTLKGWEDAATRAAPPFEFRFRVCLGLNCGVRFGSSLAKLGETPLARHRITVFFHGVLGT